MTQTCKHGRIRHEDEHTTPRDRQRLAGKGKASIISGCFLPPDDNKFLETIAIGGVARLRSLDIYELNSIWPKAPAKQER